MQVLALEAFAKRAEKLLQLLAELGRRLQLRLANAVHHSHSPSTDRASPGWTGLFSATTILRIEALKR